MSIRERIQKLKDQPETSCVGNKWTDEDEYMLIKSISEAKLIDDIAREHKRTSGGIRSRLRLIAVRMIETEGKTIEDVCATLRMTSEDFRSVVRRLHHPNKIDVAKKRREKVAKNTTKLYIEKPETELDILKNIREILLRMEAKLLE